MKKYRIAAYERSYGRTRVYSKIVEAPNPPAAVAIFEQRNRRSWVTHITEL